MSFELGVSAFPFLRIPFPRNGNAFENWFPSTIQYSKMLRCAYSFHLYQVTMGSRVPQNGNPPGIRVSRYGNAFENWFSSTIQYSKMFSLTFSSQSYQVTMSSRVPKYGNPPGFRVPRYGNPPGFPFPGTGTRMKIGF